MEDKGLQAIKERAELVGELGEWKAEHDEDINFILHALGDVNDLVAEVERLRKALEKIEKKTSDKSVKTIVQVTLDPTKYERHKNLGDPF